MLLLGNLGNKLYFSSLFRCITLQIETHFLYGSLAIHGLVSLTLHSKIPEECPYSWFLFFFYMAHMVCSLHFISQMLKGWPLLEDTFTVQNIHLKPREVTASVHLPAITTSNSCRPSTCSEMLLEQIWLKSRDNKWFTRAMTPVQSKKEEDCVFFPALIVHV